MLNQAARLTLDDDVEVTSLDLTDLHRVYMSSIRQHQKLLTELCKTLSKLGVAIDTAPLELHERDALAAGLDQHVTSALGIIAGIDSALSFSAPLRRSIAH